MISIVDEGIDKATGMLKLDNASVKHKSWRGPSDYNDFIRYFKILAKNKHTLKYNDQGISERSISIKKLSDSDAMDIVEKIEDINKSKT